MKIKIEKALGKITEQMESLNDNIVRFVKEQPNAKIVLTFLDEANVYECMESARQVKLDYENGISSLKPDTWDVLFGSLYIGDCVLDVGLYIGDRLVRSYFIVGYRPMCPTLDSYWVSEELYLIDWSDGTKVKRLRKYTYPLSNDAYKFVDIKMLDCLNSFMCYYSSNPNVREHVYDFRARLFGDGEKVCYDFEYCKMIG